MSRTSSNCWSPLKPIGWFRSFASAANTAFDPEQMQPFYVHQHIELPEIKRDVTHYILQKCDCPNCGMTVKAKLPANKTTGYGPRLTALGAELSGIKAMSCNDVK